MSVRRFVGLWFGLISLTLAYAFIDLSMNPGLWDEVGVTIEPDLSRIAELAHWGGRLLRQNRALLVGNVIAVCGLIALFIDGLWGRRSRRGRRRAGGHREEAPKGVADQPPC